MTTTRKIVGKAEFGTTAPASGVILFTPTVLFVYEDTVYLPAPIRVDVGEEGEFEVELLVTDNPNYAPAGWVWRAQEMWTGGRTFTFELTEGPDQLYTELIPATSIADPYAAHIHSELEGLPPGGTVGQFLVKQSPALADADWQNLSDFDVVFDGDPRLTNDRPAVAHGNERHTSTFITAAQAPVQSVNSQAGIVVLNLNDLNDVTSSAAAASDLLNFNGTAWVPTSSPTVDTLQFDVTAGGEPDVEGELIWNDDAGTIELGMNSAVIQRIGEDQYYRVQADENIARGDVVMAVGTVGNSGVILAAKARPVYNMIARPSQVLMGVAANAITQGQRGYVMSFGQLRKINTNQWAEGTILYANPSVAGGLTATQPAAPNWKTIIALVVTQSSSNGALQVRPTFGSSLANDELVELNGVAGGDTLIYDTEAGRFEPGPFPAPPVTSVNTQTGDVELAAGDVGALPDDAELGDLADVDTDGVEPGDVLAYDGDGWVPDSTAVRSTDVRSIVVLTETEYGDLDPADPDVLYVVVEDPEP